MVIFIESAGVSLGSEEESQERALRSGDKTQSDVIDGSKNKGRGGVKDLKAKGQRGLVMALYYTVSPI